jgi:hypothetical protein
MLLSSVLFTFVFRGVCDEKLFFNKQTLHTSANIIPWTWVETRSFLHLLIFCPQFEDLKLLLLLLLLLLPGHFYGTTTS